IISVVLVAWIYRAPATAVLLKFSLALILAGALGNLWDRVTLGYVVDFIQWHYNDYYWPAFNIADAAISVGAVAMVIDSFRASRRD
ncbi:signal peptidase II, partial [Gammaproteobacteria bacterium 54_18_T64]